MIEVYDTLLVYPTMLKLNKLCNVCKQIEHNKKLVKDIYNTKFYLRSSSVSLKALWEDYSAAHGSQFSYEALLNHCKKHQFMNEKDFASRELRQIATKAEKDILKRQIESKEVWDSVINKGMARLENDEMPMKTADLLKAAKDKSDYELKVKDQELAMMEMVMFFASGEATEAKKYDKRIIEGEAVTDFDPTVGIAEDSEAGTDGPSGVYYPPAWDAATSGPGQVPAPDF